jgi:ParB-like chromosome segregation protein Spo0J
MPAGLALSGMIAACPDHPENRRHRYRSRTDRPGARYRSKWYIDDSGFAKNARVHTDAQVAAIAASIKEWGWTTPALVGEDGGLIAGHARVLAARQLGIAEIPVMVAAGWTEAQKRAYVLADNQLAITGSGWDPELLQEEEQLDSGANTTAGFAIHRQDSLGRQLLS